MDVETILQNHGIMPMTEKEIVTAIKDILTKSQLEKFEHIIQKVDQRRCKETEQKYWEFAAKYCIYPVFDCLRYDEYVRTWPRVLEHMQNYNKILDVGCGCGLPTIYYALNLPDSQITAVDICNSAINVAKTRAKVNGCQNITFQNADMIGILADNEYDLVLASCVIGESAEIKETYTSRWNGWQKYIDHRMADKLSSFRISLKDGGRLVCLTHPIDSNTNFYADQLKQDALEQSLEETHREIITCNKNGIATFLLTTYVAIND